MPRLQNCSAAMCTARAIRTRNGTMLRRWIYGAACFFFGAALSGCVVQGYEGRPLSTQDRSIVYLSRWSNIFQVDGVRFDLRDADGQVTSSASLPWYARAIELRPGHTSIRVHITLRARDVGEVDTKMTALRFVCSGHGELLAGRSYRLTLSTETLPPRAWLQDDEGAAGSANNLQLHCESSGPSDALGR